MIHTNGDFFFPGGFGEDIFGETYAARIGRRDDTNKYLLMKMMREYV